MGAFLATSKTPAAPIVELIAKRPTVSKAFPILNWSRKFTKFIGSLRLRKALPRPSRIGFGRSEEHTSELQSLMRISYAVFCLKKKNKHKVYIIHTERHSKQQ